jgi:hypothetical protein
VKCRTCGAAADDLYCSLPCTPTLTITSRDKEIERLTAEVEALDTVVCALRSYFVSEDRDSHTKMFAALRSFDQDRP